MSDSLHVSGSLRPPPPPLPELETAVAALAASLFTQCGIREERRGAGGRWRREQAVPKKQKNSGGSCPPASLVVI